MWVIATIIFAVLFFYFVVQAQSKNTSRPGQTAIHLYGTGMHEYEIVGESYYQKNIKKTFGVNGQASNKTKTASILYDNHNKYDPKAIAVFVNGKKIGHLSKREARNYRNRMDVLGFSGRVAICSAMLVGGGKGKHYGVYLDYDPKITKKHYMEKQSL